jgi:hypothetical protein
VERHQLTISDLKQGLQVVDVLVDHVLILDLQFKHNAQAAMAPYKEVHKDIHKEMQKGIQQSKITFFTKTSVSSSIMHTA